MPRATETKTARVLRTMAELRAHFTAIWEEPLRAEGFARQNVYDATRKPDAQAELDSLVQYQKLVSSYGRTAFDMDNRERALVEFASPVFTMQSLQDTIIPRKSFVEKVVRQCSMLYKDEPVRWLANEEAVHPADGEYQSLISGASICSRGKEWYKKYVLTRCVCVRPVVRMKNGKGILAYDIMTPNEFRVMLDENNEIEKLLYQVEVDGEFRVAVWTRTEHYYRTVGDNTDMVNPYGFVPAVLMTDDDVNIYGGGMFDLAEANLYVNFLELLQTSDIAFSALSVWVATNMGMSEGAIISPDHLYSFEDVAGDPTRALPPKLENVASVPHSQTIRDLMEQVYKRAMIGEGISAATLETQARDLSGKALREMKAELLDRWADDADIMREKEADLYYVTAIVANYARRIGRLQMDAELPVDAELFNIDFADQSFEDLDADKRYELEKKQVQDGILAPADWFRIYNSDVDDTEDVLETMRKNRADLEAISRRAGKSSFLASLNGPTETPTTTGPEPIGVPGVTPQVAPDAIQTGGNA